jgi:hypothetical protein
MGELRTFAPSLCVLHTHHDNCVGYRARFHRSVWQKCVGCPLARRLSYVPSHPYLARCRVASRQTSATDCSRSGCRIRDKRNCRLGCHARVDRRDDARHRKRCGTPIFRKRRSSAQRLCSISSSRLYRVQGPLGAVGGRLVSSTPLPRCRKATRRTSIRSRRSPASPSFPTSARLAVRGAHRMGTVLYASSGPPSTASIRRALKRSIGNITGTEPGADGRQRDRTCDP